MALRSQEKKELIDEFATKKGDTGSSEVQIALLTKRINQLTEHLKLHKKDHSSRRGLLIIVNRRRHLLNFLKEKDEKSYKKIIKALKIRK